MRFCPSNPLSSWPEGGLVDRLRRVITPMPSAQVFTEKGNLQTVEKIAGITETRFGFWVYMNFAPVVDIIDAERNKFVNGLIHAVENPKKMSCAWLRLIWKLCKIEVVSPRSSISGYGATELIRTNNFRRSIYQKSSCLKRIWFPYFELF